MTAFNIVRMKPKPDRHKAFLDFLNSRSGTQYDGQRAFNIIDVGGGEYMLVGEWESMDALAAARTEMVGTLDGIRDMLEDLGGDLGVTDPRSGEVVASSG